MIRKKVGRPPFKDKRGKSIGKTIKISREVDEYLTLYGTAGIERLIRNTKHFKVWKASMVDTPENH